MSKNIPQELIERRMRALASIGMVDKRSAMEMYDNTKGLDSGNIPFSPPSREEFVDAMKSVSEFRGTTSVPNRQMSYAPPDQNIPKIKMPPPLVEGAPVGIPDLIPMDSVSPTDFGREAIEQEILKKINEIVFLLRGISNALNPDHEDDTIETVQTENQ